MDIAELGLKIRSDGVVVATDRLSKLEKQTESTESATHKLAKVAGILAGALATALSVNTLANYADAWSDMQSRVGAAVKDMEAAPELMDRLVDVANASYSPLAQTVEIYGRNVGVLKELGLGAQEAADYTESLNHMLVITATRGERAASVQEALSKAMAVGKLQTEGLETVLANGGRVAEALATELGTTVNGLRAMASQGKITSEVISNALLGSLEDVRKEAAEMPATITDGFTRINNGFLLLIGTMDQVTGASSSLASILLALGDGLIALARGDFASWMAEAMQSLSSFGQILMVLAATQLPAALLALGRLITTVRAVGAVFLAQYYLTSRLTMAMGAFSKVVALAGGPLGIAVAALTALGFAAYSYRSDAIPLAESLTTVAEAQRDFNNAMREYDQTKSSTALSAAKDAADAAVASLQEAVKSAQAELDTAKYNAANNMSMGMEFAYIDQYNEAITVAEGRLASVRAQLDEALSKQAELSTAQAALAESMGIAVEQLTEEQVKAFASATEMLSVSQQRIQLYQLEAQYGKESAAYKIAELAQERALYYAKVSSLNVAWEMKAALMASWQEEQTAADKTREWDAAMGILGRTGAEVLDIITSIGNTEPGSTWLDTAISKAGTLWSKLRDAAGELGRLGATKGPGMTTGNGEWAKNNLGFTLPGKELLGLPKNTGGGGGGGGGGGVSPEDQFKKELDQLKQTTAALTEKATAYKEARASGQEYGEALALLEEEQKLLNQAQEAGVTITPALRDQIKLLAQNYLEAKNEMERLQEQTQKGEDALKGFFGSLLEGADAAREAVINLIAEIAKVQFVKGAMGLLNAAGGGWLTDLIGNGLSFAGGGDTGNGPRSGGLDGQGGFMAMLHPKETVIDRTLGQSSAPGNIEVGLRLVSYVDENGNWKASVQKISDASAAKVGVRIAKDLPRAVNKINNKNSRTR